MKILFATVMLFVYCNLQNVNAASNAVGSGQQSSTSFVCQVNADASERCTCYDYLDCKKLKKSGKCDGDLTPVADPTYDNYSCKWKRKIAPGVGGKKVNVIAPDKLAPTKDKTRRSPTPAGFTPIPYPNTTTSESTRNPDLKKQKSQRITTPKIEKTITAPNNILAPKNQNSKKSQSIWCGSGPIKRPGCIDKPKEPEAKIIE